MIIKDLKFYVIIILLIIIFTVFVYSASTKTRLIGYSKPVIVGLGDGRKFETSRLLVSEWRLSSGVTIQTGNSKINYAGSYVIKESDK